MLDCVADAGSEIIEESKVEKKTAQKIFNMMAWYPMVMAIGVFLVALISFIVNSGFANEIALIKSEGLGAIEDIWTEGTSGYFYNPWICISVGAVYLVLAVKALIGFYKSSSSVKVKFTFYLILVNLGVAAEIYGMNNSLEVDDVCRMIASILWA